MVVDSSPRPFEIPMIKLRLKRFGKKRETSFRIVACNSTSRRDGRPLQELGFYNPSALIDQNLTGVLGAQTSSVVMCC